MAKRSFTAECEQKLLSHAIDIFHQMTVVRLIGIDLRPRGIIHFQVLWGYERVRFVFLFDYALSMQFIPERQLERWAG